jgi:hypothetical protein
MPTFYCHKKIATQVAMQCDAKHDDKMQKHSSCKKQMKEKNVQWRGKKHACKLQDAMTITMTTIMTLLAITKNSLQHYFTTVMMFNVLL